MANQDEAKVAVIPVLHPSGDVHNIAVPVDTPLSDFHDALVGHGYGDGWAPYQGANVDSFGNPKAGPSKEGVLENDPKFKAAAQAIWDKVGEGRDSNEAGTTIDQNVERGPIVVGDQEGHMSMVVGPEAVAQLHTHPNHFKGQAAGGQPSGTDIDTAKKIGRNVYVVSKSGLQMVDKYGKVTVVYTNPDWMRRDNK